MPAALVVDGVHRSFGQTRALAGATLEAERGTVHAVVGENGSGKSTLVKILSGVLAPDRGRILIDGHAVSHPTPRKLSALGVEAVFQEVLIVESASVLDNVYLGTDGLFRASTPRRERRRRCAEMLEQLTARAIDPDAIAETLPLSVRQWLTIARALVREPRVLILDESSAALDLEDARRLGRAIEGARATGTCVILVTHRIAELESLADQASVLRNGATVATLDRAEISEQSLLELMTGNPVDAAVAEPREDRQTEGMPALSAGQIVLRPAAAAFSAEVRGGEIVGLAGLEGHGQREFAQVLAGIARPHEGDVRRHDGAEQEVTGPRTASAAGIAYVSGDRKRDGILPTLSVLENFGISSYGQDSTAGILRLRSTRRRFRRMVDRLAIRAASDRRRVTTLSGGNQQKLLLARALALNPQVLVLDDASRGVDIETKHDVERLLQTLVGQGVAVVVHSSELEELERLCDRVLVFRHGTLAVSLDHPVMAEMLEAMFGITATVAAPLEPAARNGCAA